MTQINRTVVEPVESSRIRAIKAELEKCAKEYQATKEQLDKAEIEYDAAREKFSYVRRRASDLMSAQEWWAWRLAHSHVLYAGMPIGEAIDDVLWGTAWDSAFAIVNNKSKRAFDPTMTFQEIYKELDKGGFEFRTPSPLREINAAMMQLKNVVKFEQGKYMRADAENVLNDLRTQMEEV